LNIIEAENIGLKIKIKTRKNRGLKASLTALFSARGKHIDEIWPLRGVNLKVKKGEVLGIIGRSASGKSTLLRVISKVYPPTEGRLRLRGTISPLLTSTSGFQRGLSGIENIYYYGKLAGLNKNQVDSLMPEITTLAGIEDFIHQPVNTLFSDMLARLGFAITVSFKQDIILIDEAMDAGDARFKKDACQKLEALISSGQTVLLISHHMETINRFAQNAIWIDNGEIIAKGTAEELSNQYLKSLSPQY
jgi:ABC-type polysaccharide/polyol phosphate transport system ATPase subunit